MANRPNTPRDSNRLTKLLIDMATSKAKGAMRLHKGAIRLQLWEKLAVSTAVANFAAFILIDIWLGGDALSGRIAGGHYLLNNHGTYTEVTRAVFIYSEIHAWSVFPTHGLAILAGLCAYVRSRAGNSN